MSMAAGMVLGAIGSGMKDAGMSPLYWAQGQKSLTPVQFKDSLFTPQQVDAVAGSSLTPQGKGMGLGSWGPTSEPPTGTTYNPSTDKMNAPTGYDDLDKEYGFSGNVPATKSSGGFDIMALVKSLFGGSAGGGSQ